MIDHLVVIYQENWAFDSLFGTFPGANGLANALHTVRQVDKDGQLYAALPAAIDNSKPPGAPDPRIPANLPVAPFDLGRYIAPDQLTGNPVHRYYQHIFQIDGGKMDKFIAFGNTGGLVMSYYDGTTLPLGRFARDYALCDNFFQAAFGGSFLNHVWLIAAATPRWPEAPAVLRAQLEGERLLRDGDVTPDGYIVNTAYTINAPHPPTITDRGRLAPSFSLPTIGDRLSERGVSWRCTAIIVSYDELGGRWDHVAPPVVDRWGPGSRVPAVVISPFARRRFVDHTYYDTTSILKFIETRWKLAPLGPRDAAANDLTAAFDFTQTPAS